MLLFHSRLKPSKTTSIWTGACQTEEHKLRNLFYGILFYIVAFSPPPQVLSFTHPVSFHSAETFESLLGCLKMDDEKVAEAALQIFKNTGSKMEESFPHIKSYVSLLHDISSLLCLAASYSGEECVDFPFTPFSFLLPQVFYCQYCKPKQREDLLDRLNMPSTASTQCSATETHTLPKYLRSAKWNL